MRAIIYPYHFHKKRREWTHRAFRPQPGTDRISVIRLTYMGVDFCKSKGKEIAGDGDDKEYTGLAVITADQVGALGLRFTTLVRTIAVTRTSATG